MRIRELSNDPRITTREYEKDLLTNTITYTDTSPNIRAGEVSAERMEDVVTPRFKTRMFSGEIIVSPLEQFKSVVTSTTHPKSYLLSKKAWVSGAWQQIVYSQGWAEGPWSAQRRLPRTPIPLMTGPERASELTLYGSLTQDENAVLARALERATSPEALGLVTLAELDKTIDLVRTVALLSGRAASLLESIGPTGVRKLEAVLRQVRRRGYNRAGGRKRMVQDVGKELAKIASAWLGFRYGIMTTAYDIESWSSALSGKETRTRAVAVSKTEYSSDTGMVLQNSTEWRDYYLGTSRKRSTTLRAGVLVQPSTGIGSKLGLDRVLTSLYELVPFSFVLDWVLDVGTLISAFEGSLHVRPLGSWLTYEHTLKYSRSYDYRYDRNGTIGGYLYECQGVNDGTVSELCYYRKRIANPRLLPIPTVNIHLTGKRGADAVSLLAVNAKRIKRWAT